MKAVALIAAICAALSGCDSKEPELAATPASQGWKSYSNTDKFDDSVTYIAEVQAGHTEGLLAQKPVLVALCKEGATQAFIDWRSYVAPGDVRVQSRLDQAAARSEDSRTSPSGRATYMPDAAPKLKEFLGATTYITSVEAAGIGRVHAEFNISGAEAALKEIRRACNW